MLIRTAMLRRETALHAAATVAGGVLFSLGFPSIVGTTASATCLSVGLCLLLLISTGKGGAARAGGGLVLGHALAMVWLPVDTGGALSAANVWAAWAGLTVYGASFPWVALLAARGLREQCGLSWSASLPSLWFLAEVLRAHLFGGYDWLAVGFAAVDSPVARHLYGRLGAHGVSALIVLVGCALVDAATRLHHARDALYSVRKASVLTFLAPITFVGWPQSVPVDPGAASSISVVVVQGQASDEGWQRALSDAADGGARWIATAEGANSAAPFAAVGDAHVLVGEQTPCGREGSRRCVQNSYVHHGPNGDVVERYSKRVLVPLYEGDLALWRARQSVVMRPGVEPGIFDVEGLKVGVAICYEIVDARLVADLSERGANVVVHPTSDTWQRGRTAVAQHVGVARVRAMETGIPIVRISNREATLWIDPKGGARLLVQPGEVAAARVELAQVRERSPFGEHRFAIVISEVLVALGIVIVRFATTRSTARS